MSSKKFYLAGPMTGIAQFNFPAFRSAAARLRSHGYVIISPAEMDSPAVQEAAMASPDGKLVDGAVAGETWGQMLARDVQIIADDVKGIVFLPGWEKSRGARLEAFVGLLCGHEFINVLKWEEDSVCFTEAVSPYAVLAKIITSFLT